jgi:hypothetical protein
VSAPPARQDAALFPELLLELPVHLRDIETERHIETEVTRILRRDFSFRFVAVEGEKNRMGSEGLEAALIGTLAHCGGCRPSEGWLGNHSPVTKIRDSGLWPFQHLSATGMTLEHRELLARAVETSIREESSEAAAKSPDHDLGIQNRPS